MWSWPLALPRSLYIGFIIGICFGFSLAATVPTAFEPFRFPRIHPLPQKSLEIHLSYSRPLLALRRLPIGVLDRRLHLRPPLQLLRHLSKIKGWELLVLSSLVVHSGNQSSGSLSLLHPPLSAGQCRQLRCPSPSSTCTQSKRWAHFCLFNKQPKSCSNGWKGPNCKDLANLSIRLQKILKRVLKGKWAKRNGLFDKKLKKVLKRYMNSNEINDGFDSSIN